VYLDTGSVARTNGRITERDNAGWGLGQEEIQRRRVLFWDIYSVDAWMVRFLMFDFSVR
jgi:hypothetical protein